jgi:hypothetical protein
MSTLEALKQLKVQVPTTSCLNYSQHLIGALPDLPLGPSAARVILLKPSVRLLTDWSKGQRPHSALCHLDPSPWPVWSLLTQSALPPKLCSPLNRPDKLLLPGLCTCYHL